MDLSLTALRCAETTPEWFGFNVVIDSGGSGAANVALAFVLIDTVIRKVHRASHPGR